MLPTTSPPPDNTENEIRNQYLLKIKKNIHFHKLTSKYVYLIFIFDTFFFIFSQIFGSLFLISLLKSNVISASLLFPAGSH